MKKSNIIYTILLIFIIQTSIFAYEVKSVKIIGKTVKINFKSIEKTEGKFSEAKVREIGDRVLEKYHNRGYTEASIDKIEGKDNGVLEIHVNEPKIIDVEIIGVDDALAEKIRNSIIRKENEIYNEFKIHRRARINERIYRINLEKIETLSDGNRGIYLKIFFNSERKWNIYYSAGMDSASIVSPTFGFIYPFEKVALDINATIGFGEKEFRKGEGGFTVFIFWKNLRSAFYISTQTGYERVTWQTKSLDYETIKLVPKFGYRHILGLVKFDVSIAERIDWLRKYDNFEGNIYDTQLNFVLTVSDRGLHQNAKEGSTLQLGLTGGWETLNDFGYITTRLNADFNIFPAKKAQWFSLRPWMEIMYTTSFDRFFWEYIFSNSFIVVFDDLSATKWKNVAGLDIMFEAYKNRFFLGPFINAGYFMDENQKWAYGSGMGLKTIVSFYFLRLSIVYAWDVEEDPTKGGVIFYLSGKF